MRNDPEYLWFRVCGRWRSSKVRWWPIAIWCWVFGCTDKKDHNWYDGPLCDKCFASSYEWYKGIVNEET